MKSNRSSLLVAGFGILVFLVPGCQKREIRGIEISYRPTESTTYDIIELAIPNGSNRTARFLVSGSQLKWKFDDLNDDGKPDLTFSSEVHKTYFAKFLIQESEPKIRLLDNKGITVTELPK